MLILSEILGQSRAVEILQRALQSQRLAQAYLFAGPKGCGKHTTGLTLAKALNCFNVPNEGCHECDSCQLIEEGKHPDVLTLLPEGKQGRIPIQTIRKQVIQSLGMPPHQGRARVFLIQEAASMEGPAANALLKTLEEPPPNTHFILGTTAPIQLLSTIRSRCQRINFQALPAALQAKINKEEEQAETINQFAEKLALVTEERGLGTIVDLAQEASFGKKPPDRTLLLAALAQCAQNYHIKARAALSKNNLTLALCYARRAKCILNTQATIKNHNTHGQLSVEDLLITLRSLPLPVQPFQ